MKSVKELIAEKTYELNALQELFRQEDSVLKKELRKFTEDKSKYEDAKAKLEKEIEELQNAQGQFVMDDGTSDSEIEELLE